MVPTPLPGRLGTSRIHADIQISGNHDDHELHDLTATGLGCGELRRLDEESNPWKKQPRSIKVREGDGVLIAPLTFQ